MVSPPLDYNVKNAASIAGYPVADHPGFPDGGGRLPHRWGSQPIIWSNFSRKLHENERNWTQKGCMHLDPHRSTNGICHIRVIFHT